MPIALHPAMAIAKALMLRGYRSNANRTTFRREQMVASFNRGYGGFERTYRICTPAADIVIRRYTEEGAKIPRDITARFAN